MSNGPGEATVDGSHAASRASTNANDPTDNRKLFELLVLLAAATLSLAVWSFVVPIFETPDEPHHWQYARYLHDNARLPTYGPDFVEANSPPLYYALIAPLAAHTEFPPQLASSNESGQLVLPFAPRFYQNTGDAFWRYWPIRLGRLLTVCMSVLTVLFCYLAGREATGRHSSGLLSAGLVAFLPQFTFRGMSLSNDALVTTMAAGSVYMLIRLVRQGFTWRTGAVCGAFVALAYLSKISAICLTIPLALTIITERLGWRLRALHFGILGVPAAMVAPWTARNIWLYGDPFASAAMHTAVAHIVLEKPLTSEYFYTTLPYYLSRSFVGMFGWMNIVLPEDIYMGFWILGVVSFSGLVWSALTRRLEGRVVLVLATIIVLNVLVVVHINRTFTQPQGRYLFPCLPALAVLMTVGLEGWPGWLRYRQLCACVLITGLAILNAWVLVKVVIPAYYPPVAQSVSYGTVSLGPATLSGLSRASDGSMRITNGDPQYVLDTQFCATEYGFLQLELEGNAADPQEVGSIFFLVDGQPATEAQRVDFEWRADGTKRIVKVPLLKHPRWRGTITGVRIDPINSRVDQNRSTLIRVGAVQVRGTF